MNLGSGDIGILNYSYALEQLEAAFYIQVVANAAFATTFNADEQQVLIDLRNHEVAHREFLKAALGANAIPALTPVFGSINFASRTSVLQTAMTFEDLGVTAYNGAGPLLTNPDFLAAAGKIVSVEARHASAIRDLLEPGEDGRLYDVTIENLTNGRPFSPGVVVTHTSQLDVFTVGETASAGVKAVAEAGNEAPLAGALQGAAGAGNVMRFETPTVPMNFPAGNPKPNRTIVRITAPPGSDRLSVVTMLMTCTNDGFTGVDAVQLPMDAAPVSFTGVAYDARAEVNNEQSPFIVPGCSAFGPVNLPIDGNALAPESGVIIVHPGLQGTGDLPAVARWTNPVPGHRQAGANPVTPSCVGPAVQNPEVTPASLWMRAGTGEDPGSGARGCSGPAVARSRGEQGPIQLPVRRTI